MLLVSGRVMDIRTIPMASMGLVYLPTFSIKINQMYGMVLPVNHPILSFDLRSFTAVQEADEISTTGTLGNAQTM